MKSTAILYRLSSLIAGSWLAGATVFAARFENNLERNFPVSAGGKLVLEADQGSCEVIPVQTGEVQVRVLRRVEKGSKAQAEEWFGNHEVTFMAEGKTISVIARKKKNLSPFPALKGSYLEVRYEIRVPNSFNLDLNTSGGDIRIGELDGSVRARTSSGLIQLQRASGAVDAADSGGNVILGQIGGNLVAHTSSGSIDVDKLNGSGNLSNSGGNILVTDAQKGVVAKTSSGAITLKSVKGGVEASNSGGDITIDVAGGGVAASTSSGSIIVGRVQGQSVDLKNSGGDIRIEAAAGNVKARTSSGSISIKAAQGTVQAVDSGGDIKIGEAGEVTASTSSGSIHIKYSKGKVDTHNSGGDITIEKAGGTVLARTSSGRLSAGFVAQPTEDCRLEVSGGDIQLALPTWIAVDLDAKSSGGSIHSELPVATMSSTRQKGETLQGKVNQGGPKLILRSSSGQIQLRASKLKDGAPPKAEAESK